MNSTMGLSPWNADPTAIPVNPAYKLTKVKKQIVTKESVYISLVDEHIRHTSVIGVSRTLSGPNFCRSPLEICI